MSPPSLLRRLHHTQTQRKAWKRVAQKARAEGFCGEGAPWTNDGKQRLAKRPAARRSVGRAGVTAASERRRIVRSKLALDAVLESRSEEDK
eukprot:5828974-Pleurochrysis_carterae.AAC.1